MRRTAAVILSSALIAAPFAAVAADASPPSGPVYNIMGPSTCAGWPKAAKPESAAKAVPLNWVLGFASGEAQASDDLRLLELMEPQKIDAWMGSYCETHPSDSLPVAGRALVADLAAQLPPKAPPPPPEPPMFVPPQATPPAKAAPKKPAARRPAAKRPAAKK